MLAFKLSVSQARLFKSRTTVGSNNGYDAAVAEFQFFIFSVLVCLDFPQCSITTIVSTK